MKAKIIGLSLHSNNAGDIMTSPLDYFEFPVEAEKLSVDAYDPDAIRGKFIIYGGGGLIHLPSPDYFGGVMQYLEEICDLGPWLISWGVGHNIHGSTEIRYPESFVSKFRLHGVRDIQQDLPWVPCASCMSPLFDRKVKATRKIVAVGHSLDSYESLDGIPKVEHTVETPETIIKEILSAKTVLTNSYHGAYWGALLGKKTIVFNPMSSKFFGLPKSVALTSPDAWETATPYENRSFLNVCRRANRDYYQKVLEVLGAYISESL